MSCVECKQPATNSCKNCKILYCSTICQRIGWKNGHNKECGVFSKQRFEEIFPQYTNIGFTVGDSGSWKSLTLWITWAEKIVMRNIVLKNSKDLSFNLDTSKVKTLKDQKEYSIREFAHAFGFPDGRILHIQRVGRHTMSTYKEQITHNYITKELNTIHGSYYRMNTFNTDNYYGEADDILRKITNTVSEDASSLEWENASFPARNNKIYLSENINKIY